MAVEALFCPENLRFPMCDSQDWVINPLLLGSDFDTDFHFINNQSSSSSSYSVSSSFFNSPSMAFRQFLASEIDKEQHEIDHFLRFQNERLRLALEEQRRQQLVFFMNDLESKALIKMKQKDEEIAKATKRTTELQNMLIKTEMENQSWQRLANSNEAMVIHLKNTIEQVRKNLMLQRNEFEQDDAESNCDDDSIRNRVSCKNCKSMNSCMLFLPCKHVSSCKSCEAFLGFCPVCKSLKEGCLEVFLV